MSISPIERKCNKSIAWLIALSIAVQTIGFISIDSKLEQVENYSDLSDSLETNDVKNVIQPNEIIDNRKIYDHGEIIIPLTKSEQKVNDNYLDVPECDTSFKTYMDYRCITDETSIQWKIQQNAWTDSDGFRRINNDYIVAVGTYYSSKCGERFRIVFDDDDEITVTVGDLKQNRHTDKTNRYTAVYNEYGEFVSANVLEFIVDTKKLSKRSKLLGSVNNHDYLNGNVKIIERIEEKENER